MRRIGTNIAGIAVLGIAALLGSSVTSPVRDFGMTPPSVGGLVTVDHDATVELQLLLERES